MNLNKEQMAIMSHTDRNRVYCGDSPDMQELVEMGLMESLGRKSFVPDEYFRLTGKGRSTLNKVNVAQ